MTIITDFVAKLEADAKAVESKIVQFADKFIPEAVSDVEIALSDLADIAMNAVIAAAPEVLSGSEKFGTAVTSVIQTVEASGKTVATATAQMAVQQAYLVAQSMAVASKAPPSV